MPLYRVAFVRALYAFMGGMTRAAGLTITAQLKSHFDFHRFELNNGYLIFSGSELQQNKRQSMTALSRRHQGWSFCDMRSRIQALGSKRQVPRCVYGPKVGGTVLMMRLAQKVGAFGSNIVKIIAMKLKL